MVRRESVPPMRPRDVVINGGADAASAPLTVAHVKSSVYLRPDQVAMLDEHRAAHRAAGRRTVSASDLIRAALDLAVEHGAEWEAAIADVAR